MAINYRINYFDRGHFGDFTIYTKKNGQVIIRVRHNRGGKGIKTFKTQCIRVRLANLVRLWQVLGALLKNAFSDKEPTQSDFNRFIQLNFDPSNIYLDHSESRKGVTIGTNVVVSSGQLPPISFTDGQMQWVSDLCVGSLVLDENTTIGQLTDAVVKNNDGVFKSEDDLYVLQLRQMHEEYESYYYCEASNDKLEFDLESRVRVLDLVRPGALTTVEVDGLNYLALPAQEGLFTTLIHARTKPNDEVLCSYQTLLGKSQQQREYSSDRALLDAIVSYGGVDDENFYRRGTVLDPLENLRRKIAESSTGTDTGNGSGNQGGSGSTGSGSGSAPTYQLTVVANPSGKATFTITPEGPYHEGDQVQVRVTPVSGYSFTGWQGGGSQNPRTVTIGSADQTLTANLTTSGGGGDL